MSAFESIVRPFAAAVNSPPIRDFEDRKYTPALKMQFGKSGGGKQINGSLSMSANWYKDTTVTEIAQR